MFSFLLSTFLFYMFLYRKHPRIVYDEMEKILKNKLALR
jgi:hypothetical protein